MYESLQLGTLDQQLAVQLANFLPAEIINMPFRSKVGTCLCSNGR